MNENNNNNLDLSFENDNIEILEDVPFFNDIKDNDSLDSINLNDNTENDLNSSIDKLNKLIKKKEKVDLNSIPLPLFDCKFCANEKLFFQKLINERLSENYLYNANKNDIDRIGYLITHNIYDFNNINDKKICYLQNLLINNSEYIFNFFKKDLSNLYIKCKANPNINFEEEKDKLYNNKNVYSKTFIDLIKEATSDQRHEINKNSINFDDEPFNIWKPVFEKY